MRFLLRTLLFATGLLLGGEALRRWLEQPVLEAPTPAPIPAAAEPTPPPALAAVPDPPPGAAELSTMSRADLYERAQQLEIKGRSKMSKADLVAALRAAEAG